ncbi:MAG: hypothetical protein ACJ74O_18195 [Frankiaceae bacterium]
MTIVRFPTKVRLTLVEGEDCEPLVAAAVECTDAALSRAVRRAATLHLVRDAHPDPKRAPHIDVRLSGAELPPRLALRLRTELTALAAAHAAALSSRPGAEASPARRELGSGEPAAEELDETRLVAARWNAVDDAYLVPSYDRRGAKVALRVTGGSRSRDGAAQAAQPVHLQLVNIATRDDLQLHLLRYFRGAPPSLFVAIYRDAGRPVAMLLRVTPDGAVDGWRFLGSPAIYPKPTREGAGTWHQGGTPLDADGIELYRDAATPEDRAQIREDMWVDVLRREAGGIRLSEAKLRAQARRIVERMPDPGGATSYYWLLSHGVRQTLMEFPAGHSFIGTLPLAVLTEAVSETAGTDGTGADDTVVPLPYDQLSWFDPDPAHAFLGEPPVEFWPAGISAYLSDLIADIATKLDMVPGRFPGMFCMAAVVKAKSEARRLGPLAGSGKEGDSPRMTMIRRLASAFTPLMQLQLFYLDVIGGAARGGTLPTPLRDNSASWMLHFLEEHVPRRNEAVGALFVATCQDILLDVLETSHVQILARLQNFTAYMAVTRALILLILVDEPELTALRETLDQQSSGRWRALAAGPGGNQIQAWYDSTRLVVGSLGQVEVQTDGPAQRGRVRFTKDGPQVQDSVGRWWTRAELDSVLAGGRQQAFALDPLLEKVADLPDTVEQLRSAGAANVDAAFNALLHGLSAENEAKTQDVRDDVDIAFGLATFKEADITSNAAIGAELSGVHAQADAALRPLFPGDGEHAYVAGMRYLVDVELGKASFLQFFNIVGLTAIAIFCPPLAFAIGALEAAEALDTAIEHRGIQRAMLGGDQILTKAQAEAELWGAAIGAALVFIPEVPGLVRGVGSGVSSVVRGETREAATVAGQQLVKRAAVHLAELAAEDLLRAFVTECVKGYLLSLAIDGAIGRLTEAVAREVTVTGHASITDLPRLVGDAITGPPEGQP